MTSLRSRIIHLAHANPRLRPHLLPLLKSGKTRSVPAPVLTGDPFLDMDDQTAHDFEVFSLHVAAWMQRSRAISINRALGVWVSSAPLRRWIVRNLSTKVGALYYGKMVKRPEDLPPVNTPWISKYSVLHWSKRKELSEVFAGFIENPGGAGGYLVEASSVPPREIIIDIPGLSDLCRKHSDTFQMVQINRTASSILLSSIAHGEEEVLTTNKVVGQVIESRLF